jgi:probable F420-dependent oxidoreductase
MRFSVSLPTDEVANPDEFVTGPAVMEMAAAAEAAGFSGAYVTDHPAGDAKWLAAGGHHALDPFVALSFAAAATTTLRVQTHILVLPYRNPLLAAKSVLSLEVLSGGRTILGVAPGYLKAEFRALGVDFDERNDLLDEGIDTIRAVLGGGTFAGDGRHWSARGVEMLPARPAPPIWIGGNSRAALRRAVDRGDGWVPFPNPPAAARTVRTPTIETVGDLAARLEEMRAYADEVGRAEPLDVCFAPFSMLDPAGYDPAAVVDEAHALAALGVTWLCVGGPTSTRAEWRRWVDRFATDVLAVLAP